MLESNNLIEADYRTSSFSGGGNCVQVARLPSGEVAVKQSSSAQAPLVYTAQEWAAFVAGVKHGEFDIAAES